MDSMNVFFYNIKWDTDGMKTTLPKKTTIEVDKETDIVSNGADILSDKYGFCVISFNYKILE